MTIGISRAALLLLTQLSEAYERGHRNGPRDDELWFTVSEHEGRTTIQFADDEPPLHTSDRNAVPVLLATGSIERFTTIFDDGKNIRYVVTSAGLTTAARFQTAMQQD